MPTDTNLPVKVHLLLELASQMLNNLGDFDSNSPECALVLRYVELCFNQAFEEVKNWKEE
jgi:hypothetical protein